MRASSPFRPWRALGTFLLAGCLPVPAANILIPNAPFYEKKWALSAGLDVGVNVPLSERASFIAETGVRYVDDLEGDDSAVGPLGLSRINDTGRRISVPVTLALRWDF